MRRRRPGVVRQMPRIYGNLQREQRDFRPFLKKFIPYLWTGVGLVVLYVLFFGSIFRVRTVEVQGVTLSNPDEIRNSVPLGGSLWAIPTAEIRQEIMTSQPVREVRILRGLPSSIRLIVQEEEPVVAWVSAGQLSLLDEQGVAFLQYPEQSLPPIETALGHKIASLPRVVDTQNLPVEIGKKVVSASFVSFVKLSLENLQHYVPDYTWEKAEVSTTLYDITFVGPTGLKVAMNTLADSGVQVRNFTRLVQAEKVMPNSFVDLRIDRWAYIHE